MWNTGNITYNYNYYYTYKTKNNGRTYSIYNNTNTSHTFIYNGK